MCDILKTNCTGGSLIRNTAIVVKFHIITTVNNLKKIGLTYNYSSAKNEIIFCLHFGCQKAFHFQQMNMNKWFIIIAVINFGHVDVIPIA